MHRILDIRGLADFGDGRVDLPEGETMKQDKNGSPNTDVPDVPLAEWSAEALVEYAKRGPREREIVESILSRRWMER